MPEVPGGAVVVALAFLLFVLSVSSAAVVELVANARNWRGRMLHQAIEQLHGREGAAAIYDTRRVRVLHGPRGRLPSYLPARVYATAATEAGQASDTRLFDDLMDRATGWYKRRVQWAVLLTALLACVALNLNAFSPSNRFLKDEAIKDAVVAQVKEPTDEEHEHTDRDAPGGMDSPTSVPS